MPSGRLRFWRFFFLTPVLGAVGLSILWALGLASFLISISVMSPKHPTTKTDGIVVLTGGTERVRTGLILLQQGLSDQLLISGTHKTTRLVDVIDSAKLDNPNLPCCITLGFQAADTIGNAQETAAWVRAHKMKSLRIVTAAYHMPRAIFEMRRLMPDTWLIIHPVTAARFQILTRQGLALAVIEYHKAMIALARLGIDRIRRYGGAGATS